MKAETSVKNQLLSQVVRVRFTLSEYRKLLVASNKTERSMSFIIRKAVDKFVA